MYVIYYLLLPFSIRSENKQKDLEMSSFNFRKIESEFFEKPSMDFLSQRLSTLHKPYFDAEWFNFMTWNVSQGWNNLLLNVMTTYVYLWEVLLEDFNF